MSNKVKRFFMTLLVLVMSISMFAVPVQAADNTPTVEIPVAVELSGTEPRVPEIFQIQLTAGDAAYSMPTGSSGGTYTLPISGDGSGKFSITFNRVGVYTYRIQQKAGTNPDCYQDQSSYDVTISITNAEDGGLTASVAIYLHGSETATKQYSVVFKNRYANPVTVPLTAIKTLNSRPPKDDAFSFVLKDENGLELERVSNVAKDVTFTPLAFDTEGTYVYKISEVIGKKSSIIYDKSVYTVTIKVEKDENGDYQAEVSCLKGTKAYEGTPRFANKTKSSTPTTGDLFRMGLWVSLMVISVAAVAVLVTFWLKKRKK